MGRAAALSVLCAAVCGSILLTPAPAAAQSAQVTQQRISATSDYELAATLAGGSCESVGGSHSVALASGENWPDALAGTALDRPLLLTKQAFLPAATREYLAPCSAHPNAKVIILGGPAAVSEDVANTLRTIGYRVDRIAGADRYDTARRAARAFAPPSLSTVYLASGINFADAVAVAPSVSVGSPLILTTPDALHPQAQRFLTDAGRSVASVTILGGHGAISADVETAVRGLGIETRRVAGADRYETAARLARLSFSARGCHPVVDVAVANGTSPYGGLVAAAVRNKCQPLLLAPPADSSVPGSLAAFGRDWLLAAGSSARLTVTAIGSMSAVADAVLGAVATGRVTEATGSTGPGATGGMQAWEQVAASVVLVQCTDSSGTPIQSGSGFAIGDGRQIVTNHHVVFDDQERQCAGIRAWFGGTFEQAPPSYVTATLERSARTRDLALLSLDPAANALPPVAIATDPLRAGEPITALGYPGIGGETMTLTTGRYSGITQQNGVTWIKTDTQIAPGNSGGPAFDDQRQLVGVASALVLAQTNDGSSVIGTLGLLAPASDVAALLAGDIGEEPSGEAIADEGDWSHGTTTSTNVSYVILATTSDQHSLTSPYDNLIPVLIVFCDDIVRIDFWDPVLEEFKGPHIAGQIAFSNRELHGRVPVFYRIGGKSEPFENALWWPAQNNEAIFSGGEGHAFVRDLLPGSGELAIGYTNFDGETEAIVFREMDGFAAAHHHLQRRCRII
ncbi:cell wall-binding repeat-containing protein [Candidatus Poriferisodalis sp.]|uniref:cell wall-binding repeat-containing protein n=1 Tax=Candidatus Poriferisodalis sp. TaxID=3101277 RepID=UPI003C6F7902